VAVRLRPAPEAPALIRSYSLSGELGADAPYPDFHPFVIRTSEEMMKGFVTE
jgi:hypothetical protein